MIEPENNNSDTIPPFVKKAVFIASLGGILFGYDTGVISGALPQLKNEFDLSNTQSEMIVSFLFIGGAVGSAIGGTLCDTTGRKKAILLTDVTFAIAAAQLFLSKTFTEILIGRIVMGFAVAVSAIADVSYLHEISPVEWRGAIVSVNEACISLGFLVSYFVSYGISQLNPYDGWRYMFGLGSCIAIVQFCGMLFMPESPSWLRDNGKEEQAKAALQLIHGSAYIKPAEKEDKVVSKESDGSRVVEEDYGIQIDSTDATKKKDSQNCQQKHQNYESLDVEFPSTNQNNTTQDEETILQKFCATYRQVIITIFLSVMQQFCGHPNVLNYAPEIFNELGVASLFSTLLVGVLKFLVTCFVIVNVDDFGRRHLLLLGMIIISISLFLLTIAFSTFDEDGNLPIMAQIVAVLGIFGVAGGYAVSFGPLTWLLVSELFPSTIRGRALGLATIISQLAGALVSYTFLSVQDWLGPSAPFGIYFTLTSLSIGFSAVALPDTAGKDPQSIQKDMESMWFWRKKNKENEYIPDVMTDSSHQVV